MIATIAVIATITVKKKEGSADHNGNHSPAIAARIAATTIAESRKSSILAIVVAAIAELVFLSDRSDRSDHMETRLYCDKSTKRFAAS